MKNNRYFKFFITFLLITSWIFSGWPQIQRNPAFPTKIRQAQAASSGPLYASAAVDDAGIGALTWTNPGYATTSNDQKASVVLTKNSGVSHYIKATGFGFSIPTDAHIDGIVVEWEKATVWTAARVKPETTPSE